MEVKRVAYKKEKGKGWRKTYQTTDPAEVYRGLAMDMVHKKIHQCGYIKRISRFSNYDGTQTITVLYDNDVKSVYVVEN